MLYQFTVDGPPVPKGRPRLNGVNIYTPKPTAAFERTVRQIARNSGIQQMRGGVCVALAFYLKDLVRRDLDNLEKAVLDALNPKRGDPWGAWVDDAQVVQVLKSKHLDRENPRVEVVLTEVADSPFAAREPKTKRVRAASKRRAAFGPIKRSA